VTTWLTSGARRRIVFYPISPTPPENRVLPASVQNFIRQCRFVCGAGEVKWGWSDLVPG
jgi:hypothetical protein